MNLFIILYYYLQNSWYTWTQKYDVASLNARDKQMIKFEMAKILNTELIRYDPIFFKFIQVHKNE